MKLASRLAPIAALALAWLGYFMPWVAPKPVALQLSAHDLVEWMTFLQTVRDGTFPVTRLDLSLPLAGIALLIAHSPALLDRPLVQMRVQIRDIFYFLAALVTALLILPPYPFVLTAYNDPELSPQFWLSVVTAVVAAPLTIFAVLRPAWARWLIPSISIVTLIASVRAYTLVQPALTDSLTQPAPVGYGYVLTLLGLGAMLLIPIIQYALERRARMSSSGKPESEKSLL